jgi:hypothetical protein
MSEPYNENLRRVLTLTQQMLELAEAGDEERVDTGCGVLYGTLRDSAFKLRRLALAERDAHRDLGMWSGSASREDELAAPGM